MAASRLELLPGEEVLVDIRPHWVFLSGPLAVSAVVVAAGVGLDIGFPHTSVRLHWVEGLVVAVPLAWLAARTVRWLSRGLVVTRYRVMEQWGIASRRQRETRLAELASVGVVQGLLRRVLGTGTVELVLRTGEVRTLYDVRKPVVLRRILVRRLGPVAAPGPRPSGW